MASPTRWAWVWVNSGSWWWTGRPGVLWFMGSQRVRCDWVTELNWTDHIFRFPAWCNTKESTCQCRKCKRCGFSPWAGKIHWRRKWQPTPVFLPGESHGQRGLVGYSPWGCKELDTTEQLSMHTPSIFLCLFSLMSTSILSTYWPVSIITYLAYWIALKVFVRSPPYWNVCDVALIISSLDLKVFRLNTTLGLLAYWINPIFKRKEVYYRLVIVINHSYVTNIIKIRSAFIQGLIA